MLTQFNCPNCGAPVKGARCDYCGTTIERMMEVALGKMAKLHLDDGYCEHVMEIVINSFDICQEFDTLYADNQPAISLPSLAVINFSGNLMSMISAELPPDRKRGCWSPLRYQIR